MPNEDFVSRQWLIDEYHRRHKGPPGGALKMIEEAPAADVEPVRHGRWIQSTEECGWSELECAECSECGEDYVLDEWGYEDFSKLMNYCPNCGAKMDAEPSKEDENA